MTFDWLLRCDWQTREGGYRPASDDLIRELAAELARAHDRLCMTVTVVYGVTVTVMLGMIVTVVVGMTVTLTRQRAF